MSALVCYRCGASLSALSPPWSRQDVCPSCSAYMHCCRLCQFYDSAVTRQCLEDDAEDVNDKDAGNFCDYFKPATDRYDASLSEGSLKAQSALEALFEETDSEISDQDDSLDDAEDLFR